MARKIAGRMGLLLVAVALLAGLAACGGGSEKKTTTATAPSAGPRGTLKVGVDFKPDSWDTLTQPNTTFTRIAYEGLVYTAPDGSTIIPKLASSWDVTRTSATFHLRKGVVFHDGAPFDADAVIANLEHVRATPNPWQHNFDSVSKMTAKDPYTLVLTLKSPAPDLLANLAARGLYMVSPKALASKSYLQQPAGTGPWVLDQGKTIKDLKYVFDAFPRYWNKKAVGPRQLEIYDIPDANALYSALITGQIDVGWLLPSMAQTAKKAGMKVIDYEMLRYHLLMYDRGPGGVFGDPRVRKAVCSAIDFQSILKANYSGLGGLATQRLRTGSPAYVEGAEGYPFDLAKAAAWMKEAGNPKISFKLPFFPPVQPAHELMKESLGKIGIDVQLVKLTIPEYFSQYETAKYPLVFNTSTAEDAGPYGYYTYRFAKDAAGNPDHVAPPPALARAVQDAVDAPSADTQKRDYQRMTEIIEQDALDCGFLDVPGVWAYNPKKLDRITPTTNEPSAFRYDEAVVK